MIRLQIVVSYDARGRLATSIVGHRNNSQAPSMVVVWALHFSSRRLLICLGSTKPATSLTLILDRIELSLPSIFAPKRGADLRDAKSVLCTPGW